MFVWLRTNTYHITGGFLLEAKATVVHLHSRWFYKRLPYKRMYHLLTLVIHETVIHESGLFAKFRAHYYFQIRFCNPQAGWASGLILLIFMMNPEISLFIPGSFLSIPQSLSTTSLHQKPQVNRFLT